MNPEPEQAESMAAPKTPKKRAGVPVWRTGKPDAFLAAAVDVARTAIEGIAKTSEIGEHLAARTEGDRLVTHLFESKLPGYVGWQWYAVLTRNSRSKVITVNELGLLPSEDSILAPEWVPWAERVRPEDAQDDALADEDASQAGAAESGVSETGVSGAGGAEEPEVSPEAAEKESATESGREDDAPEDDAPEDDAPADADADAAGAERG